MSDGEVSCKICQVSVPESHNIFSNEYWRVRHSQETNILGYCILESQRHFLDLSEATDPELACYGNMLAAIMKAQRQVLSCPRVYTFSLAEAVPHFHVHVIPRSEDFPRAFKGRGIMSYPPDPNCDSNLVENLVESFKSQFKRSLV